MARLAPLIAALFSAAIATGADAADAAPARLKFDWGNGLQANVTALRVNSEQSGSKKVEATYSMCASRVAQGYALDFVNLTMHLDDRLAPGPNARTVAILAGLAPAYRVQTNGAFGTLSNPERLRSATRALGNAQEKTGALELLADPDVMAHQSGEVWNQLVGSWVGLEISPGKSEIRESKIVWPLMNRKLLATIASSLTGWKKCATASSQVDCIHVHSVKRADPQELKHAAERLLALGEAPPLPHSVQLDIREDLDLVTEPGTLKPHWMQHREEWTARGQDPKHPDAVASQVTVTTMTFRYDEATGCGRQ